MPYRLTPLTSGYRLLAPPRRRLRDRRGRGLRGPAVPRGVPAHRTPSDDFDRAAVEVFAELDAKWHDELLGLDVAVDEIPRMLPRGDDPAEWELVQWPEEVTADGLVPLARLLPSGIDTEGRPTRAQIILFRRPLELRALDDDLREVLREVLIQQVATYLGVDEDTVEDGPGAE
ncbi:metallopeptidase family protein [Gordonia zhaorongruii]|uniref:metallopeptidase family protein n=1 Tax=Gordonia zhaorongruii TaxID=2597659 RepID=UPI00104E6204|nr:metallopeptidase family protein [Gordonia zhaorongruii]